jgi:hypothetical protein
VTSPDGTVKSSTDTSSDGTVPDPGVAQIDPTHKP